MKRNPRAGDISDLEYLPEHLGVGMGVVDVRGESHVDRVFSLRGIGTVVTGTLWSASAASTARVGVRFTTTTTPAWARPNRAAPHRPRGPHDRGGDAHGRHTEHENRREHEIVSAIDRYYRDEWVPAAPPDDGGGSVKIESVATQWLARDEAAEAPTFRASRAAGLRC